VATPASPCTGVCRLDAQGVCRGCGRVLSEIAEWPAASDARRRDIVAAARERRIERDGDDGEEE
jgi:predicted Fe-S protein YdhL (DUF1289 family)